MKISDQLKKDYEKKPFLDHKRAVLSAPVRHIFMISTIGFMKSINSKNISILEIGSWFGASTLSWAQGLKEYYDSKGEINCVDAWKPFFELEEHKEKEYVAEMEKLLEDDTVFKIFLHNINTIDNSIKINYFRKMSNEFFNAEKSKKYDIIFIDADHTYNSVLNDIKKSLDLIKEGGIICGDDLNMQLDEVDKINAKKNHNKDFIKDTKTGRNFHPGVTLAVDEIFGNVNSWGGFWAVQKSGDNWINISLKEIPIIYPKHFNDDLLLRAKEHYSDIKEEIL